MKYIDEYRDKALISKLTDLISDSVRGEYTFMEVCGGHTNAIHRFGIRTLLPESIRLISGPGCPVCVTGRSYIDKAILNAGEKDVIITTFGDLIRVPGSLSSLERLRSEGADIRIVLSSLEALETARRNPDKKVIFLAIGFETTAPGTAVTVKQAVEEKISNFFILNAHKVMPPAMEAVISDGVNIDGFICPGHVAAVTGSGIFSFIPLKYRLGCVVTGFEPVDLMQSILMLVRQKNTMTPGVEIQYSRAVSEGGNLLAQKIMEEIFEPCDAYWRGFGVIKDSGLRLRKEYEEFDAGYTFSASVPADEDDERCICGEILRGREIPSSCSLFATLCIPENPAGACMVSHEGTCNTWYRYKRNG
jgi:hydrogenase expression/formation protein HypD